MKKLLISAAIIALAACSSKQADSTNSAVTTGGNSATHEQMAQTGPVSLAITSPKEGEVVKTTDVPVTFDLKNYHIEPNGQHIHVIVDNEPYQPCYTTAEPFILKGLKPGVHTIRAFPSRAWHESIKEPQAFAGVTFYVEKKVGKPPVKDNAPLLTYSRPKGKYEGDKANKILFDFYITNAELGPNKYKVKYQLDDQQPVIVDEWKPMFFENLSNGKHKLVVELLDNHGKLVKGKYNKTEREFEVAK